MLLIRLCYYQNSLSDLIFVYYFITINLCLIFNLCDELSLVYLD
jgi:hypothetical protein